MTRLYEFFEGDNHRFSMTRLLCFLSFPIASYVVVVMQTEGALGLYIGGYVVGYIGGKTADVFSRNRGGSDVDIDYSKPRKRTR